MYAFSSLMLQKCQRQKRSTSVLAFSSPSATYDGLGFTITGYDKNYNYDYRLKYQSPPKFLDPVQAAFAISVWSEENGAY